MKIYVVSKGMYSDGRHGWVRNKSHAFEFCANYGPAYALNHAIRHAESLRHSRNSRDARPVRYLGP